MMSRRAGQIRRKGDRKWLVGVFLGRDGSGKRSYKARTVHGTKKDAEKVLRDMLGKRDEGLIQPTRLSLNDFLDDWLSRGAQKWGPRTHQDRDYLLQRHVRPRLGTRWLDSINSLDLQRFYDRMQQEGASPDRLRRVHAIVRAALRTAVRRRLIPTDPTPGVELPRAETREAQALGPEEATRFLEAAAHHPMGLLFETMLATGMRPGELLGLRWADSDFDAERLRVSQTLVRLTESWSFQPPKTRRSRRSIPIPGALVQKLRDHKATGARLRLRRGAG
jgi:integrase